MVNYAQAKGVDSISIDKMPPLRLCGLASMSECFRVVQSSRVSAPIAPEEQEQKGVLCVPASPAILQSGEKVTLYFDVKRGLNNEINSGSMFVCPDLLGSEAQKDSNSPVSLRRLVEETSDLHCLVRLAHVGPMYDAIAQHEKEEKQLELDLLGKDGEDNNPSSIEAVRKRNQKLAAARLAAGLGEASLQKVPAPWSSEALGWGLGGSLHLCAMWELLNLDETPLLGRDEDLVGLATTMRVPVRPDKPDPANPRRSCPLMITCKYPEDVKHAFSHADPCSTIAYDVCITNGAPEGSPRLPFVFEATPPKEPEADDTSSKREQHCPAYALSGRTRVNVNGEAYKGGLAPGESVDIKLNAHFFKPGYYNLNCFRFHVDVGGGKKKDVIGFVYPSLCFGVRVGEAKIEIGKKL